MTEPLHQERSSGNSSIFLQVGEQIKFKVDGNKHLNSRSCQTEYAA